MDKTEMNGQWGLGEGVGLRGLIEREIFKYWFEGIEKITKFCFLREVSLWVPLMYSVCVCECVLCVSVCVCVLLASFYPGISLSFSSQPLSSLLLIGKFVFTKCCRCKSRVSRMSAMSTFPQSTISPIILFKFNSNFTFSL